MCEREGGWSLITSSLGQEINPREVRATTATKPINIDQAARVLALNLNLVMRNPPRNMPSPVPAEL